MSNLDNSRVDDDKHPAIPISPSAMCPGKKNTSWGRDPHLDIGKPWIPPPGIPWTQTFFNCSNFTGHQELLWLPKTPRTFACIEDGIHCSCWQILDPSRNMFMWLWNWLLFFGAFSDLSRKKTTNNFKIPISQHSDLGLSGVFAMKLPRPISMTLLTFSPNGPTSTSFVNLTI